MEKVNMNKIKILTFLYCLALGVAGFNYFYVPPHLSLVVERNALRFSSRQPVIRLDYVEEFEILNNKFDCRISCNGKAVIVDVGTVDNKNKVEGWHFQGCDCDASYTLDELREIAAKNKR
jgi:hypothetical protein